jgi:NAD(P)-dependent dehydrogenase (short-subunit alcohol dehydrogenase family)/acyl carrier protein
VADRAQLDQALDRVAREFGPVNGVLHLAGIAGDGMLQFRGREQAGRVLRPKVLGAVNLATALAVRPPVDIVVCFSSQAALTGMVGGADYAAANAFLDAFAAGRPGWLSINWPGWTTVGMARDGVLDRLAEAVRAARSPAAAPDAGLYHETVLAAATHWELDEHRIGGAAVLPGTGVIDLILRAYRETIPDAAGPVTLRDVVFVRPLAGDEPRRTRVSFEPAGEGTWRVRVLARPDQRPAEWQEHASAELAAGGPAPWTVPLDGLTAGLAEARPPSMRAAPDGTFVFGPRWHNIERMWESAGTTVVRLALAPAFAAEAADHAVHPALLDTGTGVLRRNRPGELMVPFTYQTLTWYAPLPDRLHSRVRSLPGDDPVADVELIADDGSVLVAIEGLRMRPARLTDFGAKAPAEPADAPDSAGPSTMAGLPPDEGVRLLLQLLAAPTPAQLAVVPPGADRSAEPVRVDHSGPPAQPPTAAPPTAAPPAAARSAAASAIGSVQDRLAEIWRQVLGRTRIGPEDDFFELGGDSLMGVALTGRIRDTFGVHLSIGALFDYPSLAALAAALREQGAQ